MNDPHVVALIYRVGHGPTVNYDKAEPLEHDEPCFRVRIENEQATFEMKEHYATEEAAREVVEPFIRAWELRAGLEYSPEEFRLGFERAEIIDRDPPPGVVIHVPTAHLTLTGHPPTIHVGRVRYPLPPTNIATSPDVRSMYDRYCGFRLDREPLGSMAYFCLTVLETSAGNRRGTASQYCIDMDVLRTLGRLTSQKGGRAARKAGGSTDDFTAQEVGWIEEAVKAIILRAAEFAHDPSRALKTITMADLPSL